MAKTISERQNKYRNKLRRRILGMFNFHCCSCGSNDHLEFAHREQAYLGEGRGMTYRLRDVYNNNEKYLLLCHSCHQKYDSQNNISKIIPSKEEFIKKIYIEKYRVEYSKDIRHDINRYYNNII